jgi:hypothetical protein
MPRQTPYPTSKLRMANTLAPSQPDFATATGLGDDLTRYLIMSYSSLGAPSSPAVNNTTTSTGTRTLSRGTTSKPKPSPLRKRKISINTMEVDKPTAPTVFDSAHDENKRSDAIEGVFDLNEFLATQVLLREENNENTAPASKKVKQKNASNANNTNATSLTPVAVGARSSKHTILLHEKYQALGIPQPMFSYEGGSETGWTVSVSFPGLKDVELADVDELQGLKMQGETEKNKRFNSKQEAKEALSKRALEVLEELENEGRIRKSEKARKQNVSGKGVQQQLKEEKEPGENYIGQLLGTFINSSRMRNDANTTRRVPALHRCSPTHLH